MAILRVLKDKNNPYVTINKKFIHDERLSFKAKGILLYLLSRPDDWEFFETEIIKNATDGLASFKKGIKELEKNNYLKRKRIRNKNGYLGAYEYFVSEVPTCENPTLENPMLENPTLENRILLSNDFKLSNNLKLSKELQLKSSSSNYNNEIVNEVIRHIEKCNFLLSPMLIEKILSDVEIYGAELVKSAAEIADEAGKHKYNYFKAILENWKSNGVKKKGVKKNGSNSKDSRSKLEEQGIGI